jgi:hypothetical protein
MKSFEHRIRELEKSLRVDKQDEKIIIIFKDYYSDCAEKYHAKCPYLKEDAKDSSGCPLYEERLKKARESAQGPVIIFTLPCFKEGVCPLCMDSPSTPTSEGNQRNHQSERKENE